MKRHCDYMNIHQYDKIGLLKPSKVTDTGHRLYDDETLATYFIF